MLKVRKHWELLSAKFLTIYLEPNNVCQSVATGDPPKRRMRETLFTRHRNTVEPVLIASDRKITFHAIHTDAGITAANSQERNVMFDNSSPPINDTEKDLTATYAQFRYVYCKRLGSYKSRIKKDARLNVCADCGNVLHCVLHLFICRAHPTDSVEFMEQTYGRIPGIQLSRDLKASNNNNYLHFQY